MNNHVTKYVGDVALSNVINDLVKKRWFVYTPTVSEHSKVDLIAYKYKKGKHKIIRIQCKYGNKIYGRSSTQRLGKEYKYFYQKDDFDYYALYLPDVEKVVYIPLNFALNNRVNTIRTELPKGASPVWWYEDFLKVSNKNRIKRNYRDFGIRLELCDRKSPNCESTYKFKHPEPNELQYLLWKYPQTKLGSKFGVSNKSISNLAKKYDLIFPPQGYFALSDKNKHNLLRELYLNSDDQNFRSLLKRIHKEG